MARDDFSLQTKLYLAIRSSCRCSNPDCRIQTHGPNSDPEKITNIGVAAHITAAAPGGPRYDVSLSKEERSNISNGIWLCANHAAEIDRDEHKYPISLLKGWKENAERIAEDSLGKSDIFHKFDQTLLQLGTNIVAYAVWELTGENEWRFKILDYVKGSDVELVDYCTRFSELGHFERIIVLELYGEGRYITNSPTRILDDGFVKLAVTVDPPSQKKNPHTHGTDFALNENHDIFGRNGSIALVHGMDAARQSLGCLFGTKHGEVFYNKDIGSYFYMYYREYLEQPELLERFIRLEIARLASIEINQGKPQFPYVRRVLEVGLIPEDEQGYIQLKLEILWGNNEKTTDIYKIFKHKEE